MWRHPKQSAELGRRWGQRPGVTLPELLISLALLAMLLLAVAVAMQGVCVGYAENRRIAEVTQTARVVLHRMMKEVRTAEAIDSAPQRISIIPPDNEDGLTAIEYQLVDGTLYYRQTVNGTESSHPIISSAGEVQIDDFQVSRETAIDGEGLTYTKTLTAKLSLKVGANPFRVTASACLRRNLTY